MKIFAINSEQEMLRLGEQLGNRLQPGALLFLSGDLGAGKTVLSKGIAKGLGIGEEVTSPTFQLKKSYQGKYLFNHLDLYRLKNQAELDMLEPEELTEGAVTVVEWGDLLMARLRSDYLEIRIEFDEERQNSRRLIFIPHGRSFQSILEGLT
ncbi:MAG: tRNA (adenosine(37)-N6)-threonylcarbamoyltransferase complex ATPase subunit type 1 TsaE [Bacillota bacterium]